MLRADADEAEQVPWRSSRRLGKERRACRRGGSGGFTQHREEKAEGV